MPVLFTFNLQTKFEVSSFIHSKDMAWAKNVEMVHVTLATPTRGIVSQQKANTSHSQLVPGIQNLKSLAVAVAGIFQEV